MLRSLAAVERSRVCVIMIDATVGFTEQDSKVAGYAHDQGKACIIAVNKWDAVEKDSYTMDKMRKQLEEDFSFMSYAPILFISAKTGQRLDKLFETISRFSISPKAPPARQHLLRSSTRKRCSIFLTSAISKTRFGKTLA